MEMMDLLKLVVALTLVLGLMGGLAMALKYLAPKEWFNAPLKSGTEPRLKIIEARPLDARRKLVLLSRDDVQHLVILGPSGETVVETNIQTTDKT